MNHDPRFHHHECCGGGGGDCSDAHECSDPGDRIAELENQLGEEKLKYLRSLADFQNYQRRAIQNEQVARKEGIASAVQGVIGVVDHFDFALGHDFSKATAQQVVQGVKVIREELLKSLQQLGVKPINPAPNDEFTPGRHEAVMQQPGEGIEPGHVVSTLQPGYQLEDRVLRPAKVVVAPTG